MGSGGLGMLTQIPQWLMTTQAGQGTMSALGGLMQAPQQAFSMLANAGLLNQAMNEAGNLRTRTLNQWNQFWPYIQGGYGSLVNQTSNQFYNPYGTTGAGGYQYPTTSGGTQGATTAPSFGVQVPGQTQGGWYPGKFFGGWYPGQGLQDVAGWRPGRNLQRILGFLQPGSQTSAGGGTQGTTIPAGQDLSLNETPEYSFGQDIIERLTGRQSEALTQFDTQAKDLIAQLNERYNRNMGYLTGAGEQEAADIAQQYQGVGADIGQSMFSRGLRGSSVEGTMRLGAQREKTADLGRLQERLRGEKTALDTALSGDVLRTQQGLDTQKLSLMTGLSGDIINALQSQMSGKLSTDIGTQQMYWDNMRQMLQTGLGYDVSLTSPLINLISGVNYGYPDQSMLAALTSGLGNASASRMMMNQANDSSGFLGLGGSGTLLGAGGGLGLDLLLGGTNPYGLAASSLIGGGIGSFL